MIDSEEMLRQRVRAIMPDMEIEQLEWNREGTLNDIAVVNQKWVFRFAKSENYARVQAAEIRLLDFVRPRIGVSVPTPIYQSADCIVYPLLEGQALDRKFVLALDESARASIAQQLGALLYRLHTLELSGLDPGSSLTRAPVKWETWIELRERVREKVYPLLQRYQLEWAEYLFTGVLQDPAVFAYQPAFIHGDLASYHVLFDPREQKISGLIDFGMAGIGDPASDFGNLISVYGETFVKKLQGAYPGMEQYLRRARFYAQALELEWVLRGLESGETFWFTAHLGGARDIFA